jgi:PAS domain S-box-containing protein
MTNELLTNATNFLNAAFTPERLKVALVLALLSAWMLCGVLAYLKRFTSKQCFLLWLVSWFYYSAYLVTSMGFGEQLDHPLLVMLQEACVGISALCMFWGGLHLADHRPRQRQLGLGVAIMVIWSYAAAYPLQDRVWITIPAVSLLALASAYAGACHLRYCKQSRSAKLVVALFGLWALHLLVFPFQKFVGPGCMLFVYLVSAALAQSIALGMLMLGLEQARERNNAMLVKVKEGVTKRRLLQREIGFAEQKYRALFDSATDAIFLIDLSNFEVVGANDAAAELVGCGATDMVGNSFVKLCPRLSGAGASLLENKRLVEDMLESSGEFPIERAQGGQVLCEGGANLVPYHKRPVLQINAREITERKKMEQQLRQTEKLTALGQLVAGVAHELNNPLAVVMGYAQILSQQESLAERVRKDLLKILHESDRAAKIVRNLLTFARPREPQMVMVDVNRLVTDALETREIQLQGANIQVIRRLAPGFPPTMADPHQIEQVLANLVTNAVQALANHAGPHVIEATTEQRNGKLRVTIADNGPGISPQILGKIFDPFFTTKGPGRGTGLGLSICYSIMEEHKGKIWVESEPGRGSRFCIELPVVACSNDVDDQIVPVEEPAVDPLASQRRLLLVDDEPEIVNVMKEVLGMSGYCIETAGNGSEAVARLASQTYDLIISDLCMPEMGGEKLFRVICERFPHLQGRIIFVTGDTVSPTSRKFLDETGAPWLSKPFNIREIERLVVETLRGEETPLSAPTVHRAR